MAERATDTSGLTQELGDGSSIPVLGLGVWQVPNGPECVNAVRWALEAGYRYLDTAQAYGNEESVGRALRDSGVPREELFFDLGRSRTDDWDIDGRHFVDRFRAFVIIALGESIVVTGATASARGLSIGVG